MDWADELAARVSGPQVINDSKTPSGTVHVGSLRGPVILDVITRALRAAGHETTLLYGVDDLDAMDAQALLTPDAVDRYMGVPLAHIPDQVPDGHASYARHHAQIFIDLFADLGVHPDRYYWMSDIYATGAMDGYIRTALDRAQVVRDLYRRVSNVQHPDTWHPILVICESCGKVGTTIVTKWDGERVFYECRPNLVTWATGCGHSGWVAPFGGRAKLPWNLEWAAQWSLFGVTIEPCGKDLATAGGSRDRSDAVAREVFEREPPINVAYEFLNIGGRKMSTSKGRGAAAHEIVEVIPPEQLRTLFIRPRPNHAIEFEPEGTDAIPRLFDEFDKLAAATAGREVKGDLPPGFASVFRYALRDADADVAAEAAAFRPAFSHLAFLAQVPSADIPARMAEEKGSALTTHEMVILDERLASARAWLDDLCAGPCPDGRARFAAARGRRPGCRAAGIPRRPRGRDQGRRERKRRTCRTGRTERRRRLAEQRSSRRPRASGCHRAGHSQPSISRSSGDPTGHGPAGSWPAWTSSFVARRLREAAAGHATINPAGGVA